MNELITFWGLASLTTLCAVLVITLRNPVTAAVFLVIGLFLLGGIFALQRADFVAAIQVIVYAGAILVLFLFVIMLLNLDPNSLVGSKRKFVDYAISLFAASGFAYLIYVIQSTVGRTVYTASDKVTDNTMEVALLLFSKYVWPFELVSMLILLAVVASILIAKKKKIEAAVSSNPQPGVK